MNRFVRRAFVALLWLLASSFSPLFVPLPPDVSPGSENWNFPFGGQQPDAQVLAVAADGAGRVFIGGDFTHVGSLPASRIAMWDGQVWQALGSGVNGTVRALAVNKQGQVFVGGSFTQAGGITVNYVARWEAGVGWSALATGFNGLVYALALDANDVLYAGGSFTIAGGASVVRVARWNGASWSGLNGITSGTVSALTIAPDQTLWAGGNFVNASSQTVNGVTRWTGSAWAPAGTGLTGGIVYALRADRSGNIWAGGTFTQAAGQAVKGLALWNGVQWQAIPGGCCNQTRALAEDGAGNMYVAGAYSLSETSYIYRWDGAQFLALPSGPNAAVHALAVNQGRLWVGGAFATVAGQASYGMAEWTAGDGVCGLTAGQQALLYTAGQPVTVKVDLPGSLDCLSIQRVQKDHPQAGQREQTGQYWSLRGVDSAGAPAGGFSLSLTLPFAAAGEHDQVCRYVDAYWEDCASTSYAPGLSVTRAGVTAFSDWLVRDVDPTAVSAAGLALTPLDSGGVLLQWDTESEADITGFHVYRAPAGQPRSRLSLEPIPARFPGRLWGGHYQFEAPPCPGICEYWLEVIRPGASAWLGPVPYRALRMFFLPVINKSSH